MLEKYRKYKITSKRLTQDELVKTFNMSHFTTISGKNDSRAEVSSAAMTSKEIKVVLLAPNSKYEGQTAEFKKLYNSVSDPNTSLMFVFFVEKINSHIVKFLTGTDCEFYSYRLFLTEVPAHVYVPIHEIADEAEVANFCDRHCTDKTKFPKILARDPIAVWIGAKPGQVVKIHRESETVGVTISYRFCIEDES